MTANLASIVPSTDRDGRACWVVFGVLTVYSYDQAVELVTDDRETPIAASCPPAWLAIRSPSCPEDDSREAMIERIYQARIAQLADLDALQAA